MSCGLTVNEDIVKKQFGHTFLENVWLRNFFDAVCQWLVNENFRESGIFWNGLWSLTDHLLCCELKVNEQILKEQFVQYTCLVNCGNEFCSTTDWPTHVCRWTNISKTWNEFFFYWLCSLSNHPLSCRLAVNKEIVKEQCAWILYRKFFEWILLDKWLID